MLNITDTLSGCTVADTVMVSGSFAAPPADAGPSQTLTCSVTNVLLGSTASNPDSTLQYAWSTPDGNIATGQNTSNATVDQPGTYVLTVTNPTNGCQASDTVTIAQNSATPFAQIAPADTLTCILMDVTLNASGSTGSNLQFNWSTIDGNIVSGNGTPNPVVSSDGTYWLVLTNTQTGCSDTSSVNVVADANIPIAFAAAPDTLTCANTQITLSGTGSTAGANISYNWTSQDGNILSGQTTLNPLVNQPGTYSLAVINNDNNCASIYHVLVPQDIVAPIADAGADPTLSCTQTSLQLDGSNSSTGSGFNYLWSTADGSITSGNNTLNPTVDATGTYLLTVNNTGNGCSAIASVQVLVDDQSPSVSISTPEILDCNTTLAYVDGSGSSSGGNFTFSWTTSDGNITGAANTPVAQVDQAGTYTLHVLNSQNGCVDSSDVTVFQDISLPNVFAGQAVTINCNMPIAQIGSNMSDSGQPFIIQWTTVNG
ncbi:MAG: hypothetical protein KC496_05390, partial [Anaerolineae bacterium]|nr:hypothetical protein [Anaerolineae bacterium]